jgi:arylsulfatase A-like enzyme
MAHIKGTAAFRRSTDLNGDSLTSPFGTPCPSFCGSRIRLPLLSTCLSCSSRSSRLLPPGRRDERDRRDGWRRVFRLLNVLLCCLSVFCGIVCADDNSFIRPNIIVILADDLGFSDLGCYGSEIQTPHLDRLAAEGLRFSQFYNCALCGPSRAALMTGLHPHQVGVLNWTGLLNERCVTACELFARAGYATCAVGRLDMVTADNWHDPAMIARYVNRFLGSTGHVGPGNYFQDVRGTSFFRDGQPFTLPPDGCYKTDLITDFAVQFIAETATQQRPFLLYMAHYAPHWPLHAKPADMAKYRGLYRQLGWDDARAGRLERQIDMGLIDGQCVLSPRDARVPAWQDAPNKDWEANRMAAYAAQVDSLDQSVGRVVDALRRARVDHNTLVLFLSDNGASDQELTAPLDQPGETWRVDGTPTQVGNNPHIEPGRADTFVTGGPPWANVSNTPLRLYKQTNHEGGIAAPCIAWWPAVIRRAGTITPELAHITDILATSLEVAGIEYPTQFAGRTVQPLAGKSLVPLFQGRPRAGHPSLCWSTSGCRAVRQGPWKLVSAKDGPWELYNMDTDRTELHDLAQQFPERVQTMAHVFEEWRHAADVK